VFPAGYHCDPKQPLPYAALGSQKNHMALYLMCLYVDSAAAGGRATPLEWFRAAWARAGKKLDMGASCVRFKRLEDVPLEVVAQLFRRVGAKEYLAAYRAVLGRQASKAAVKNPVAGNAAAKQAAPKSTRRAKPSATTPGAGKPATRKSEARKAPAGGGRK
jgi:hypothetical protein